MVQVTAVGCGGVSAGSGFVTAPGFVVTNAHVIAGGERLQVRDASGTFDAVPVAFDAGVDFAVLAAPGITAPPLAFVSTPAERDTTGATLGYPGGQPQLVVRPAAVSMRGEAVGRDIYGRGLIGREILTLSAAVVQGDSGGPFVTADGLVGGVVFAAATTGTGTGYALTAEQVAGEVAAAVSANVPVGTGTCRY
jgi:S1-C subfamily serine protease